MNVWRCAKCDSTNNVAEHACRGCGASQPVPLPSRGAATPPPQATPPAMPPRGPAPPRPPSGAGSSGLGKLLAAGCLLFLLSGACCVGFGVWGAQTHTGTATVSSLSWERTIEVKAVQEIREESADSPPVGARDIKKEHNLKVFVDSRGRQIERFEDKYSYTIEREVVVRTEKAAGTTEPATWPALRLQPGETEGKRSEKYTAKFATGPGATATFEPSADVFAKLTVGARWNAEWNNLDRITRLLDTAAVATDATPRK